MKVRALRNVNFGVVVPAGPMINFLEGDVKELPDEEPYNELVANAIENRFLEPVEGIVGEIKKAIKPKKEKETESSDSE